MGVTKKSYKSVCSFIKTHDAVEGEQQEIDYISCLYGRMGRDWWTQERYVTMHKLPSGYFIPVDVFNILLKSGNNITLAIDISSFFGSDL